MWFWKRVGFVVHQSSVIELLRWGNPAFRFIESPFKASWLTFHSIALQTIGVMLSHIRWIRTETTFEWGTETVQRLWRYFWHVWPKNVIFWLWFLRWFQAETCKNLQGSWKSFSTTLIDQIPDWQPQTGTFAITPLRWNSCDWKWQRICEDNHWFISAATKKS